MKCPICGGDAIEEDRTETVEYGTDGQSVDVVVPTIICQTPECQWIVTDHRAETIRAEAVAKAAGWGLEQDEKGVLRFVPRDSMSEERGSTSPDSPSRSLGFERAAFEDWFATTYGQQAAAIYLRRYPSGVYASEKARYAWHAWEARATGCTTSSERKSNV